jgi:hypothetical protein
VALSIAALAAALTVAAPAHAYQNGSLVTYTNYGTGRSIQNTALSGGASANKFTYVQGQWAMQNFSAPTGSSEYVNDYTWVALECQVSCPVHNGTSAYDIIQMGVLYEYNSIAGGATAVAAPDYVVCNQAYNLPNFGYTVHPTDTIFASVNYSGVGNATLVFKDLTQNKSNNLSVAVPSWCAGTSLQQEAAFFDETQAYNAVYYNTWTDASTEIGWYNTTTGQHYASVYSLPLTYYDNKDPNNYISRNDDANCGGTPYTCQGWIDQSGG